MSLMVFVETAIKMNKLFILSFIGMRFEFLMEKHLSMFARRKLNHSGHSNTIKHKKIRRAPQISIFKIDDLLNHPQLKEETVRRSRKRGWNIIESSSAICHAEEWKNYHQVYRRKRSRHHPRKVNQCRLTFTFIAYACMIFQDEMKKIHQQRFWSISLKINTGHKKRSGHEWA